MTHVWCMFSSSGIRMEVNLPFHLIDCGLVGFRFQFGPDCRSNLGLVLARLQKCGYTVKTAKLRSDSFGLPQRRCRLYFFGVRQVERMNGNKVLENLEGLLEAMQCPLRFTPAPCRRLKTGQGQVKSDGKQQLVTDGWLVKVKSNRFGTKAEARNSRNKKQVRLIRMHANTVPVSEPWSHHLWQAELLHPSDDARVTAEPQRLQAKKLKSKTKQTDDETSARWMSTHKQLAADSFLPNVKFLLVLFGFAAWAWLSELGVETAHYWLALV